jgi:hypothetical protein
MTTVRIVDGARYGFKMVGLVFGLLVVSGVLFTLGGLLATGGELTVQGSLLASGRPAMLAAGGFFGLAGVVVFYAGTVGLVHKLIADSVTAGVENADQTAGRQAPVEDATSDGTTTSESESETQTVFDRENRPDTDPIAADSPSGTEPDAEASEPATETTEPATETTEPATETVEPESVDLVDEPTKKPGQASPSSEPVADAAADRVADPGSEPDRAETDGDLDMDSGAPQDGSAEAEPIEDAPDIGTEPEAVDDTTDDSADVIDPVAESEEGDDADPIESAPETGATADDGFTGDESSTEDDERPTPEDIDRALTEATESGLGEEPTDAESGVVDDAAPDEAEAVSPADDERDTDEVSPDDVFTEPEGESAADGDEESSEVAKADVIDRAFEQEEEEDLDDAHTIIDDAIEEGEVEDTTDEPGDWEPLDESDLKD